MTIGDQLKKYFGIDTQKASADLMVPQEVYESFVEASIATTQKSLYNLDIAIKQKDWRKVQDITHDLIGVYANLRISSLRDPVFRMRQLLDQDEKSDLGPLMDDLLREFSERFEELKMIFIGKG